MVSPAGELVDFVATGDLLTTNICFGGDDLTTAYITASATGRLLKTDWPRPGAKLHHLQRLTRRGSAELVRPLGLLAQDRLENLAARVARQRLGAERDVLRHLEVGDPLARERARSRRRRARRPGAGTITAPTFSPIIASGTPSTATSNTAGCATSAFSTSTQ